MRIEAIVSAGKRLPVFNPGPELLEALSSLGSARRDVGPQMKAGTGYCARQLREGHLIVPQSKIQATSAKIQAASSSFVGMLHSEGPDPDRAAKLALYAWLVGRWDMDVTSILEDGTTHHGQGEIHAGWILQGRAIQDVWMIPRLKDRRPGAEPLPGAGNWYGTTLRIYDPSIDAWLILWNDPATNVFTQQIGRANGRTIVQEGPDPRGGAMRWTFAEIESSTFHWTAESARDGANWRREIDIRARRVLAA